MTWDVVVTEAEMRDARADAEALMIDHGRAKRPTGGYEYDTDTQGEVLATTTLFDSKYKIQQGRIGQAEVGGRTHPVLRTELHLPFATDDLQAGDLFACLTPHANSTEVAGRTWRVLGPAVGTLRTARRYEVEAAS